jgi:hypothetical protein
VQHDFFQAQRFLQAGVEHTFGWGLIRSGYALSQGTIGNARTKSEGKNLLLPLAAKPFRAHPQLSQISEVMFVCARYQVFLATVYTQPVLPRR